MGMIPDDETEGFYFLWTIQNFSYCLQKKDELLSPTFKLNLSDANEWCLRMLPISGKKNEEIGLFLFLVSNGPFPIKVKICFSIRDKNGTFKTRRNSIISGIYDKQCGIGYSCFLNHREFFKDGGDAFLENDTLTLRCRILQEYPDLPATGLCYARTVIDMERITFVWSLENFKELLQCEKKTYTFRAVWSAIPFFTLHSFLSEVDRAKKLRIEITHSDPPKKRLFKTWKITLLNAERKAVQFVHNEHWSEVVQGTETWFFTFIEVEKILENEKLYLINGTLYLHCEFTVSSGEHYSTRERTVFRLNEKRDATHSGKLLSTSNPSTGNYNLQRFYNEGKFSDLIVRTASSKEFPVHKAMLIARSEVFSAKFEHETKENPTGVVYIGDFNDDTVYKMLLFAYTGSVEDLEWETALELYSAADKYGILDLRKACFTFLIANMSWSNVCEILLKAHMLQDKDMKSATRDFMCDHWSEFSRPEYWAKFKRENSELANETMKILCFKGLKNINSMSREMVICI